MSQLALLSGLHVVRGAVVSSCGRYRYRLIRRWGPAPSVLWGLLNPSIADAKQDDHTIRKCMGFARRWGYGGIEVVNMFAWRATDPKDLWAAAEAGEDIVGPDNDHHIVAAVEDSLLVVAGWGAQSNTRLHQRRAVVRSRLPEPYCLGLTVKGDPRHPLMVGYGVGLVPFRW